MAALPLGDRRGHPDDRQRGRPRRAPALGRLRRQRLHVAGHPRLEARGTCWPVPERQGRDDDQRTVADPGPRAGHAGPEMERLGPAPCRPRPPRSSAARTTASPPPPRTSTPPGTCSTWTQEPENLKTYLSEAGKLPSRGRPGRGPVLDRRSGPGGLHRAAQGRQAARLRRALPGDLERDPGGDPGCGQRPDRRRLRPGEGPGDDHAAAAGTAS